MARLPKPGGDSDGWAHILNEYLLIAHNEDGTLRSHELNAAAIGLADIKTSNPQGKIPAVYS